MTRVLPYPWSSLAPRGDIGISLSLADAEIAEPLNAESITFFTRSATEPLPAFAGQRQASAIHVRQAMLNPQTAAGRVLGVLAIMPCPTLLHDRGDFWKIRFGSEEIRIPIVGALRRASSWEDLTEVNTSEVALRETIDLLSGFFTEAAALTYDLAKRGSGNPFNSPLNQPMLKVSWSAIWDRWKKVSTGEEPRMARVVEIAFSHLARIRDVCERPRRMLIRQREMVPVGRVQELDPSCLRDLIRRPGRTVLQKAGARQQILAITRRETVDTAENRVIRDFIGLCQHRAQAYVRENSRSARHRKVTAVADLREACERLEVWSPIAQAGEMVGAPRPNYVLQKDRRYHPLWVQYDKLRKEDEAIDNLWTWGRRLWSEFVRCVFVSFLAGPDAAMSQWLLDGELPAYFRGEHQCGVFTPPLSVSSRWVQRDGPMQMYMVHPSHAHLCPGLGDLLPRLGADLNLVVYPSSGSGQKAKALLCVYTVLSLQTIQAERDKMVGSLASTLQSVADQHPDLQVRGLLLRGEWRGNAAAKSVKLGCVDCLIAPAGGSSWFHEFPVDLCVLLEELMG